MPTMQELIRIMIRTDMETEIIQVTIITISSSSRQINHTLLSNNHLVKHMVNLQEPIKAQMLLISLFPHFRIQGVMLVPLVIQQLITILLIIRILVVIRLRITIIVKRTRRIKEAMQIMVNSNIQNYTAESNGGYNAQTAPPAQPIQYQQQDYKQLTDYYSQMEVTCAPGTENVSSTSASNLVSAVSSGYSAPSSQQLAASTCPSSWRPEPGLSEVASVQPSAEINNVHEGCWQQGGQSFQNYHVCSMQSNSQKPLDLNIVSGSFQNQQNPEVPQQPYVPYSASQQVTQTYQPSLPPPPAPFDSGRPGMLPKSLCGYVERALARCKGDRQMAAYQDVLKEASIDGTLFTRDWDTEPLFPIPNTSFQQEKQRSKFSNLQFYLSDQKETNKSILRPGKRQHVGDGPIGSNNGYSSSDSDKEQSLTAYCAVPVKHALAVRAAFTSGNYVLFFGLYKNAPNLNTYLMDAVCGCEVHDSFVLSNPPSVLCGHLLGF